MLNSSFYVNGFDRVLKAKRTSKKGLKTDKNIQKQYWDEDRVEISKESIHLSKQMVKFKNVLENLNNIQSIKREQLHETVQHGQKVLSEYSHSMKKMIKSLDDTQKEINDYKENGEFRQAKKLEKKMTRLTNRLERKMNRFESRKDKWIEKQERVFEKLSTNNETINEKLNTMQSKVKDLSKEEQKIYGQSLKTLFSEQREELQGLHYSQKTFHNVLNKVSSEVNEYKDKMEEYQHLIEPRKEKTRRSKNKTIQPNHSENLKSSFETSKRATKQLNTLFQETNDVLKLLKKSSRSLLQATNILHRAIA